MDGHISVASINLEGHHARRLNSYDIKKLKYQDSRLVSDHLAGKLEAEAKKNWDLFYKRNSNNFFKDRHWAGREFDELLNCDSDITRSSSKKMLEVGCGVGNLIYPLLEAGCDMFVYACDISHSAVELLKSNPMYSKSTVKAFQCDITTNDVFDEIISDNLDVITLIFVLSAIHPKNFEKVLKNIFRLLKPGGVLLFRDYGLYDMTQLRFKPGHKIADNFYMKQDGTRSYYFSEEGLQELFTNVGFTVISNGYVQRRTVNRKEDVDVPRVFVQAKCLKPTGCVAASV